MRLAKRFCPNPVSDTTKVNVRKNEKRVAANLAIIKPLIAAAKKAK